MKAIFLDRDGVINELIYYQEQGIIDSPFTVEQFRLLSGVGEAINKLHKRNYKVVLVSNQPGIAKGKMTEETFEEIRMKMKKELARGGAFLDGEYYSEEEVGYVPYNWVWNVGNLEAGEYILTVNLSSFKDIIGIQSHKIKIEE